MKNERWWQYMFWLFLGAYAIRFLLVLQLYPTPFFGALAGEAMFFDRWARYIAAGNWLGYDMVFPSPPFKMYYLATIYSVVGVSLAPVRLIGCIVDAVNCVLIAVIGRRLFGPIAGIASGILWACYLPALFYEAVMPGTAASITFLLAALLLFIASLPKFNPVLLFSCGLCLSVAAQARPHLMAVAPLLMAWALYRAWKTTVSLRNVISIALIAAGIIAVTALPTARNFAVTGEPGWSVNYGLGFYVGNYYDDPAGILAMTRGSAIDADVAEFTALAGVLAGHPMTPREANTFWFNRTLDYIRAHPGEFVSKMSGKTADYISNYELPDDWDYRYVSTRFSLLRAPLLSFGPAFALGMGGLTAAIISGGSAAGAAALLFAIAVIYSGGVLLLFYVSRYRLYVVPLIMICAGYLIQFLLSSARQRQFTRIAIVVIITVLVLTMTLVRVNPTNKDGVFATCLILEGVLYEQYADVDRALELYQESIGLYPYLQTPFVYSGNLTRDQGNLQQAADWYERALAVGPLSSQEWFDYALILRDLGNYSAATHAALQALNLDPGSQAITQLITELEAYESN